MSFIDKALEKAKKLQQPQEPQPARPTPVQEAAPASKLICPVMPGDEICYTITRTVAVKPDVLRRQRIITSQEGDQVTEGYKLLRTQVLQRTRPDGRNTLMVTGPLPGEGKTLTAINLAISISQEVDTTVLLVDADLRRPSVHQYFGLPPGPGLADYFLHGTPLSELLVHPEGYPKFVILPGGKSRAEAAELIGSPVMAGLVQELKHFYTNRYVIFDLPPLLSFADPMAFAPLMDGIILVVEMGRTPRESIQQSLELLKGMPLLGCVLNKVDAKTQNYYYYYNHYYRNNDKPSKSGWLKGWLK